MLTRPPDPREDSQLLAAITDGDREAFAELYRRHLPWLLVRLGRRCSSPELVDEVVQDTFVAVWRSAGRWDRRGEVAAWIWGIGIRRLVDALRRSRPPADELTEFAGVETSAEEHVLLAVQYGDVGAALASLSPELRAVVQATVLDGLTTREAARLLGIPPGTVKTRMMRARAALRERLA
ncbi:RNA polymerase sigma factor [Dactylosporangium sp. CA-092794]|uniref:RNA polymerase sigma factor n=1 Tax=Dactylosporangium sp. CA-092794 TaxID=3239929 RepID=UPI003D8DCC2E